MLNGILMAFSMYTTIPIKNVKWNEKNFPYIIVGLPFVGGVVGLIWCFCAYLINMTSLPVTIKSIFVCLVPIILTGFIHIDGYMDCCDAIFSRANLEKKHKILKDSHVGAFAVVGLVILSFIYYISVYEILKGGKNLYSLIFIPIFSRGVVGLFIIKIKSIFEEGFIASFKKDLTNKHYFIIFIVLCLFLSLSYVLNSFIICFLNIVFVCFFAIYSIAHLKGICGDICGFSITLGSVFSLLMLAIM